jgi:DNA polymerase-3 subunit beta
MPSSRRACLVGHERFTASYYISVAMNITINRDHFADLLNRATRVVGSKVTLPVLSQFLVKAGKALEIVATNLDQSISVVGSARVNKPGAVLLPAKKLLAIVKELPDGDLTLAVGDSHFITTISIAGSLYKIMGMSPSDYPQVAEARPDQKCTFPAAQLRRGLALVAPSMSLDETRFTLRAVLLRISEGSMTMVATDGRRLSCITEKVAGAVEGFETGVLIPAAAVSELVDILAEKPAAVVTADGRRMTVTVDSVPDGGIKPSIASITYTTKLVEGTYPNFENVMPKLGSATVRIKIPREAFLQAIHRAALVNSDSAMCVQLDFDTRQLTITAQDHSLGDAREELAGIAADRSVQARFNPRFIADALNGLSLDEVELRLETEVSPAMFVTDGFRAIVMPVRAT